MKPKELIDEQASHWLAARDAGRLTASEEADFNRWIEEDIRHRVAFLRQEANWKRSDRLRELRPAPDQPVNAELLRDQTPRRRWPIALAATFVPAMLAAYFLVSTRLAWEQHKTCVGGFSRLVLEDGSVINLNTNSEIRVRLTGNKREVRLLRGEGRFQVAHDEQRPFVVIAADAEVRAMGTAFSVRLRDAERVDVLVAEGTVAVESGDSQMPSPVKAGEAAVLHADRVSVSRVEAQQLERRLAWTSGRLQFRGETLGEAVSEFNRYNNRQIKLADASLALLRVGGTFNATDPESFAAALTSAFRLQVDRPTPDTIILRPP